MIITRQSIADVLSTVDDVKGYAARPRAMKIGDGWPLVGSIDRYNGLMWMTTWRILLCLGGDEKKADTFLEQAAVPIAQALQDADVLYVNAIVPFLMPTEGGNDILAAEFTGTPITVDPAS